MGSRRYVVSLDSSSSACKSFLIDDRGKIVREHSVQIGTENISEDWCEQDPIEIWEKQLLCLEKAVEGVDRGEILGIAISNQRESIIAWDKDTLQPIYKLISWQDKRDHEFETVFDGYSEVIKKKTGLQINNYFSAPKIRWILANVDYPIERIRMGTVDCWLLANLTCGESFFTDVSNASRTLLFNLETEDWDDELLEIFQIPRHILPDVKPSAYLFGHWKNIPILGMIGDQQSSLLSLGQSDNCLNCTFGTGLFLMFSTGLRRAFDNSVFTTVGWKIADQSTIYAAETGSYLCGNFVDKAFGKNNLQTLIKRNDVEPNIYIDSSCKKIFFDDSRRYYLVSDDLSSLNKEQRAKAHVNAVALAAYELIGRCKRFSEVKNINVTGGLTNLEYLVQLLADLTGEPIRVYSNKNGTALGAAYLVFLSLNVFTYEDVKRIYESGIQMFNPDPSNETAKNLLQIWKTRISHL